MRESLKRAIFRSSKLLHYILTVLLFAVYYYVFVYGAFRLDKMVLRHSVMVVAHRQLAKHCMAGVGGRLHPDRQLCLHTVR